MNNYVRITLDTLDPEVEPTIVVHVGHTNKVDLAFLRGAIGGGYVEPLDLPHTDRRVTQWHDEEGKLKGFAWNPLATLLVPQIAPHDYIVGDAVLVGFDPDTGDSLPLTPQLMSTVLTRIGAMCAMASLQVKYVDDRRSMDLETTAMEVASDLNPAIGSTSAITATLHDLIDLVRCRAALLEKPVLSTTQEHDLDGLVKGINSLILDLPWPDTGPWAPSLSDDPDECTLHLWSVATGLVEVDR